MTMTYEKARRVPVAQVIADHARCDNCRSDLSMREYAYVTSRGVYCSPTCKMHKEGMNPERRAAAMIITPKPPTLYPIPAGTERTKCKRCPDMIYWVERQPLKVAPTCVSRTTGNAYPTPDACHPTRDAAGRGFNHFADCPAATAFRKR